MAQVLIVGLGGWRLASLLVHEDGPFLLFARLRSRLGLDAAGEVKGVASLFSCVWCMSVWTSALMWGLWELTIWWVPGILGASALAITLERWNRG